MCAFDACLASNYSHVGKRGGACCAHRAGSSVADGRARRAGPRPSRADGRARQAGPRPSEAALRPAPLTLFSS